MSKNGQSYNQILRSSSIIGGAQGINYVLGMVRTKVVAVLLGPSGVGLVGLYVSTTDLMRTICSLGISSSGVREVAEACGTNDSERIALTVKTLRRVSWVTGILGWLLMAAMAYPISRWTFGSDETAGAMAILGVTLLLSSISGGQTALIQGTRRIGDLARLNVMVAIITTIGALGLYAWFGQKGIVPVLIFSAAINLAVSWRLVRRIQVVKVFQTWKDTLLNSRRLLQLGLAFMYGAALMAVVGLVIRAFIIRHLGLNENGVYQAAWAISGMFAGFILNAMANDFYPRITAAAHDNEKINRLVNEQTEIGVLLALPGLLGTLAFAPWVMHIFYSAKFVQGAEMLPWFVLGVFGRVINWPMSFIQQAKGRALWFFFSQSHFNLWHLALSLILIHFFGVIGAAWAFAISTNIHGILLFAISRHLSGFQWTKSSLRLLAWAAITFSCALGTIMLFSATPRLLLGAVITIFAMFVSMRGILTRLGEQHRLFRIVLQIPGARWICGLQN